MIWNIIQIIIGIILVLGILYYAIPLFLYVVVKSIAMAWRDGKKEQDKN